jgi:hypothetical protein
MSRKSNYLNDSDFANGIDQNVSMLGITCTSFAGVMRLDVELVVLSTCFQTRAACGGVDQ